MHVRNFISKLIDAEAPDSEALTELIRGLLVRRELAPGDHILKAGMISDQLALIERGCVRYYYLKDGAEITGEFWQEGELAASYESCILGQPSSLYIQALEETIIHTIPYKVMKDLAASDPKVSSIVIQLLERFIVESQLRVASFITETAEQRYLRLRAEMPGLEDRVHQKYIASFLGVTPVTLSRIRARLAGQAL